MWMVTVYNKTTGENLLTPPLRQSSHNCKYQDKQQLHLKSRQYIFPLLSMPVMPSSHLTTASPSPTTTAPPQHHHSTITARRRHHTSESHLIVAMHLISTSHVYSSHQSLTSIIPTYITILPEFLTPTLSPSYYPDYFFVYILETITL